MTKNHRFLPQKKQTQSGGRDWRFFRATEGQMEAPSWLRFPTAARESSLLPAPTDAAHGPFWCGLKRKLENERYSLDGFT